MSEALRDDVMVVDFAIPYEASVKDKGVPGGARRGSAVATIPLPVKVGRLADCPLVATCEIAGEDVDFRTFDGLLLRRVQGRESDREDMGWVAEEAADPWGPDRLLLGRGRCLRGKPENDPGVIVVVSQSETAWAWTSAVPPDVPPRVS